MCLYQFKNRNVFDIIDDILHATSRHSPVPKSLIQRSSGVRWDIMDEHLESMIELGLISRIENNERSFYKITNLGVRYVKLYAELKGLLDYQIEKQVGIRYLKHLK